MKATQKDIDQWNVQTLDQAREHLGRKGTGTVGAEIICSNDGAGYGDGGWQMYAYYQMEDADTGMDGDLDLSVSYCGEPNAAYEAKQDARSLRRVFRAAGYSPVIIYIDGRYGTTTELK